MGLIAASWVTEGAVFTAWLAAAAVLYAREVRKKRSAADSDESSITESDADDPNPLRNHWELVFRLMFLIGVALFAPKWLGSAGWDWNVQSAVVALALASLATWIGADYVRWRRRQVKRRT
jgi:membrane protein implicated in regulation of membrane protease activity